MKTKTKQNRGTATMEWNIVVQRRRDLLTEDWVPDIVGYPRPSLLVNSIANLSTRKASPEVPPPKLLGAPNPHQYTKIHQPQCCWNVGYPVAKARGPVPERATDSDRAWVEKMKGTKIQGSPSLCKLMLWDKHITTSAHVWGLPELLDASAWCFLHEGVVGSSMGLGGDEGMDPKPKGKSKGSLGSPGRPSRTFQVSLTTQRQDADISAVLYHFQS